MATMPYNSTVTTKTRMPSARSLNHPRPSPTLDPEGFRLCLGTPRPTGLLSQHSWVIDRIGKDTRHTRPAAGAGGGSHPR